MSEAIFKFCVVEFLGILRHFRFWKRFLAKMYLYLEFFSFQKSRKIKVKNLILMKITFDVYDVSLINKRSSALRVVRLWKWQICACLKISENSMTQNLKIASLIFLGPSGLVFIGTCWWRVCFLEWEDIARFWSSETRDYFLKKIPRMLASLARPFGPRFSRSLF